MNPRTTLVMTLLALWGATAAHAQATGSAADAAAGTPAEDADADANPVDPRPEALSPGDGEAPPEASFDELLVRALRADDANDAVLHTGSPPSPTCRRDATCLARLADTERARLVLVVESGRSGNALIASFDLLDVRTGIWAGAQSVKLASEAVALSVAPKMMAVAQERVFEGRVRPEGAVRILVLPVVPLQTGDETEDWRFPWTLAGATGLAAGSVTLLGSTGVLYALSLQREFAIVDVGSPSERADLEQQRDSAALASLMTGMMSGGLMLFAVMGATHWLLEEL